MQSPPGRWTLGPGNSSSVPLCGGGCFGHARMHARTPVVPKPLPAQIWSTNTGATVPSGEAGLVGTWRLLGSLLIGGGCVSACGCACLGKGQ